MPEIYHPDWDPEKLSCDMHGTEVIPCEKCVNERRPGIVVYLTEKDREMLREDPDMTTAGLFPEGQEWLADQIID